MIKKGSRYEDTPGFTGVNGKKQLFGGIRSRKIEPAEAVLEYTVKEGDRLDLLSLNFYNNTQRWWRILDANPRITFGADLMLNDYVGETILIPRSVEPGRGR